MAKVENGVLLEVDESDVERLNNGESWEDVFGPGITKIGEDAFYGCVRLTKLSNFPRGLTEIGRSAFNRCTAFTQLPDFPESLTKIEDFAFLGCERLTKLPNFPKNLTKIGEYAFYGCERLTRLPGFLEGLTTIGKAAFAGCTGLEELPDFPENLTEIGDYAFRGCTGLIEITIPATIERIGRKAFSCCDSLRSVVFKNSIFIDPEWLEEIGLGGLKQLKVGNDIIVGTENELKKYSEPGKELTTNEIEDLERQLAGLKEKMSKVNDALAMACTAANSETTNTTDNNNDKESAKPEGKDSTTSKDTGKGE